MRTRSRLARQVLAALAVAVTAVVATAGSASGQRDANHCFTNAGVDFNEVFGVPEQFVNDYCSQVPAGEYWRPYVPWVVNTTNEVFPDGYAPTGATPLEDFMAKLEAVKVVVDGGTAQARTFVFSPDQAVRTDVSLDQLEPGFPPLPMAATMPRVKPLRVGEHTWELIWVLSAMHCDGLGASVAGNCLPAGEVTAGLGPVTVVASVAGPVRMTAAVACREGGGADVTFTVGNAGRSDLTIDGDFHLFLDAVRQGGRESLTAAFVFPAPGFDVIPPGEDRTFLVPLGTGDEGAPGVDLSGRRLLLEAEVFVVGHEQGFRRVFTFPGCPSTAA